MVVIHNGVGAKRFTCEIKPRAVFFRQLIYFFLYDPNQFTSRLLRCVLIYEVGKNRRQVGVLHGDGDAITAGQKLIRASTPIIDPPRAGGHLDDDSLSPQGTSAFEFGADLFRGLLEGAPWNVSGVDADGFLCIGSRHCADIAGAGAIGDKPASLLSQRRPRLERPRAAGALRLPRHRGAGKNLFINSLRLVR